MDVLPTNDWKAAVSPGGYWTLGLTTSGTIIMIYLAISIIQSTVMVYFLEANHRFRTMFGFEYESEHVHLD